MHTIMVRTVTGLGCCLALLLFVMPLGAQEQLVESDFKTEVQKPAYLANGPVVAIGEANSNFHTAAGQDRPFPELKGEYFGQAKPGPKAEPFAVSVLVGQQGHYIRSVTFSPDGTEAFWPVIDMNDNYRRWIVGSRMQEGTWTPPELASFSKKGFEDDVPCISTGGDKMLFVSRRPLVEGDAVGKEKIWIMTRDGEGWSDPVPLPEAVNAPYTIHQQVSLDGEDNLYFSGEGTDGHGSLDIYVSRYVDGEYQQPQDLGPVINGPEGDYTPFIAADGSCLIFTRNIGERWTLLLSFRDRGGAWSPPADLREIIEGVEGMDLGNPFVTHDGRYLIFFGERDGGITPFWTDTSFIEDLREKALEK